MPQYTIKVSVLKVVVESPKNKMDLSFVLNTHICKDEKFI